MPRKAPVADEIHSVDETEGFLLEQDLLPSRTRPSVALEPTRSQRVSLTKRKMDWEGHSRSLDGLAEEVEPAGRGRDPGGDSDDDNDEDGDRERCVICLMGLSDRTIVGVCGHEFCFACIGVWSNQSRRCPLCSADMAPFLLHDLDNGVPTKFYLPPLPTKRSPLGASIVGPSRLPLPEERTRPDEIIDEDELATRIEGRREIYQRGILAKHIGSNKHTGFKANPTPRQIADDPSLIRRATAFLRRELRVWSSTEAESLTTYIVTLLKSFDLRSEPAVRLISEVLEPLDGSSSFPHGAEHLAHELYSFMRSPYNELWQWDDVAQYDPRPVKEEEMPQVKVTETRRSRSLSKSSSRSPSPLRSPSRSRSLSSQSYSSYSSYSRSPSPRPLNDQHRRKRGSFIDSRRRSPLPLPRRNPGEADSWVDPEYAAWLEEEKKREEERRQRRRRGRSPVPPKLKKQPVELLPVNTAVDSKMRMDEVSSSLNIKGAARLSLLDRLSKAKAEPRASAATPDSPLPASEDSPVDAPSISSTSMSKPGARAAAKARLEIRESKARREAEDTEAEETDSILRTMDRGERAREVRRRLMVLKILAAETDAEKRARELKERLVNTKRAKALREQLLKRKLSASGADAAAQVGTVTV